MSMVRPGNKPCGGATKLAIIEYRDLLKVLMEHPDYAEQWDYGVPADQYLIIRFAEAHPDDHPGDRPYFSRRPRHLEMAGQRGEIYPSFSGNTRLLRIQIAWAPESAWCEEPAPIYGFLHRLRLLWRRWRWRKDR